MRVLVTGVKGQLGFDVIERLKNNNIECLGVDKEDFDLINEQSTKTFIINYNPDVVIHCAAYTAVDKAEDEKELCYKINVLGTKYIADICSEINAKMVYISTDYVFDGAGEKAFDITDVAKPINYYGKTKYQGELEVQKLLNKYFIIRISWVFGLNGNNFVKTMLRLAKDRDELSVISDQIGSPTYTYDLAKLILKIIQTDKYGIYHATNEGYCSWYEFANEIFEISGMNINVKPITTEQYPTIAIRPKNSKLSKNSLDINGFNRLRDWKKALEHFLKKT